MTIRRNRHLRDQRLQTAAPRAIEPLESRLLFATFNVINNGDAGAGSLRQAILDANANSGADTIVFAIPGGGVHTIAPLSPLPASTGSLDINGYSQSGASGNTLSAGDNAVIQVELDGAQAGSFADGLTLAGGKVVGLSIVNFSRDAIRLTGTGAVIAGNFLGLDPAGTRAANGEYGIYDTGGGSANTIGGLGVDSRNVISGNAGNNLALFGNADQVQGNYIGTNLAGNAAEASVSGQVGVYLGTANAVVGGATPGAGNVISGNDIGIFITGVGANLNLVAGNLIGTNASGTAAVPNARYGVFIDSGALNNTVGGTSAAASNVISGNTLDGVRIGITGNAASNGNLIEGNYIGTDLTGALPLGNGNNGVVVEVGSNNTIGGTAAGAGNLISGNATNGIQITSAGASNNLIKGNYVGTNAAGTLAIPNAADGVRLGGIGNVVGGTVAGARNIISGNTQSGIQLVGGIFNRVQGNYIGMNAAGAAALPNSNGIVLIAGGVTVGGVTPGAGNVISGNTHDGIQITGVGASNNVIEGNYIGTDSTGANPIPNANNGINILAGAAGIVVGGTIAGARNIISGNFTGISIAGAGTTANVVEGNYIGTDPTGTIAVPNNVAGITVQSNGNTIGGTVAGARNIISGNTESGIQLAGVGNKVQGNYIGTDVTGNVALGNGSNGIGVDDSTASGNVIGGLVAGARNVISANQNGITIGFGSGTIVQGNYIGTNAAGTAALGNVFAGVFIGDPTSNNTIGGTARGAGNTIAFNGNGSAGSGGVIIGDSAPQPPTLHNAVENNSIFSNNGRGIQLGSNGANGGVVAPTINSVVTASGKTTVNFTVTASPNTSVRVEFYATASGTPGQGQRLLIALTVSVGASGTLTSFYGGPALASGQFITATMTDAANDTSAFSSPFLTP